MYKSLLIIISILALVLTLFPPNPSIAASNVTGKKIVIDPGHGGTDTGTTECSTLVEKEATLQIARILRDKLQADSAIVTMTRDSDVGLGNTERANIANAAGGQALVSVHLNGSTNHSANYTKVLYGKRIKDLEFANVMHSAQYPFLGIAEKKTTNFASGVLLKSDMPAVITESVFLSNTTECTKLSDGTARQTEIAQSMYNGLNEWFRTH
ncbi:MAG TPA: N-acetylmuramoyl-L-alanine amidase [Patescibacteria group bacterium]|nr:N-acetylmuramoyl-L-alanine amidase [Patescibacteria group bacterium]